MWHSCSLELSPLYGSLQVFGILPHLEQLCLSVMSLFCCSAKNIGQNCPDYLYEVVRSEMIFQCLVDLSLVVVSQYLQVIYVI